MHVRDVLRDQNGDAVIPLLRRILEQLEGMAQ